MYGVTLALLIVVLSTSMAVAGESSAIPPDFKTSRPIRTPESITVTVGQTQGDFRGNDDKVIQSAIDYVYRFGGGTVQILPGTYEIRNSVYMSPRITLRGSGESTILRKCASKTTKLIRDADKWEFAVQVENPDGFSVGGGVWFWSKTAAHDEITNKQHTITAIKGNVLYLDRHVEWDYLVEDDANASTIFPVIRGIKADDIKIEDMNIDGNRSQNSYNREDMNTAISLRYCNRAALKNLTVHDYNNDGIAFLISDDCTFDNVRSINNVRHGFHMGSGGMRPIFRNCTASGNGRIGFYLCYAANDVIIENCVASENKDFGIRFGHRDTDNIVRGCKIERNGQAGVAFQEEDTPWCAPERNIIEKCLIRDNGEMGGVNIAFVTRDITIRGCTFENTGKGKQKVGIQIGRDVGKVTMENNKFIGAATQIEDLRQNTSK